MISLIIFAVGACFTTRSVLNGEAWYWIAMNVVLDAAALGLAVRAVRRM